MQKELMLYEIHLNLILITRKRYVSQMTLP